MSSRASRKRQRRERQEKHSTASSKAPAMPEREAVAAMMEDREKIEEAERMALRKAKEPEPNPYVWDDDNLRHRKDGRVIAHVSDFPAIERCRELNARANRARGEGRMGRELFR